MIVIFKRADLLQVDRSSSQLTTVGDDNRFFRPVTSIDGILLHGVEDLHTGAHFSKYYVCAVEMRSLDKAEEEL